MTLEKTNAFILKSIPYRESSYIIYVFTKNHGLIHCIAKGIRAQKRGNTPIERGFLIELIVYIKQNRDLHIVHSIQVLEYFPHIRSNIIKCTIRDVAFESILSAITQPEVHKEIFEFFLKFLYHIDTSSESRCYPYALWLFFHRFSQYMGFGIDMEKCISCGSDINDSVSLAVTKGGLECKLCCGNTQDLLYIPVAVIAYLSKGKPNPDQLQKTIHPNNAKEITSLLADYCRYHFGTQNEYKSLVFLKTIT